MATCLFIASPSCCSCSSSPSSSYQSLPSSSSRRHHSVPAFPKLFSARPRVSIISLKRRPSGWAQALVVDPSDSAQQSLNNFIGRMEKAWLISKQPQPVSCTSCNVEGLTECPWCNGTGFFILGDNMLCEVPSRNTKCLICLGQGSVTCKDCKGTGYRARWLAIPPLSG